MSNPNLPWQIPRLVLDKPSCPAQSQIHEKGPAVPALRDAVHCLPDRLHFMNKNKRSILAIINFVALFGAIVTAGMLLMHRVPKQTRTPEEYRSRIERITSIEKMQAIAIDDDEYIRT